MRVALVTHQFFPAFYTGVERQTLNLATQLSRMGHECVILTPASRSSGSEEPYSFAGTWVRPIEVDTVPVARPWIQEREVGARLARLLEEEDAELVHVMQPLRLPRIFSAAKRHKLPIVAQVPDFGYFCARLILRRADGSLCVGADDGLACVSACGVTLGVERVAWGRSVLSEAAAVICGTRFAIDVFASQGFDTAHWRLVPWGTDYALHAGRLGASDSAGVLRVGFIGTLLAHKGARTLVEAMRLLSGRRIELRIYGESFHERDYEDDLRRLAEGDDRIRFEGRYDHEAFRSILEPLDAVAIPSLWHENLPMVGLNAVASGVPLVTSDVGGLRELVEDYRCGFTFRAGDPESLAELLDQLVADPSILASVRGRMRYPPSLEQEAWQVESIYTQVLEQRPQHRRTGLRMPRSLRR